MDTKKDVSNHCFPLSKQIPIFFTTRRNFGQGRYIAFFDEQVKVHSSVRERIKETANNETPYTPSAYNWDLVQTSGMLTYVD
jgi:hypothetical protein